MEPIDKIKNRSASWRGTILHDIAYLERYMDMFIANYFCNTEDKVIEFIVLILGNNRLSLDGKRKLIDNIFHRNIDKWKSTMKDYSENMNVALAERNFFAHNATDTSEEAIKRCDTHLGLLKFGINTRTDWYDKDRMEKIQNSIRMVTAFFELAMHGDSES